MTSLESGARSGPDGELEPLDDPLLRDSALDLATLAAHWAAYARRQPMTAENMTGADRRAQRMGRTSRGLMEQAGFAVAVTARALLNSVDRVSSGRILVLCGPGNNGGDGFVAARHLAEFGLSSYAVLVSGAEQPGAPDARANWDALAEMPLVERIHVGSAQDALL
ncbi:MAG TPA: NAD(P)H-hydrate epimerase, partial [Candidatus Limnocylindrales bacterium]|nr:NAD(P)H-hydrate epimerase [Candidatus Limnocylindrales bacterium]